MKNIGARYALGNSACTECKEKLKARDIEIIIQDKKYKTNYHTICGKPKINKYIDMSDIFWSLFEKDKFALQQGILKGNSRFTTKHVSSAPSKNKRCGIEIFKFVPPNDILRELTLVCKEFYHISWEEELGKFHCSIRFNIKQNVPNWRGYYITLAMRACIGCDQILKCETLKKCPMIKEYLCRKCKFDSPIYKMLNKTAIMDLYNVNPNVLNLQLFVSGNSLMTYQFMVDNALAAFRNKNKDKILQEYGHKPLRNKLVTLLDAIDVKDMKIDKVPQELIRNVNLDMEDFKDIYKFIKDGKGGFKTIIKSIR